MYFTGSADLTYDMENLNTVPIELNVQNVNVTKPEQDGYCACQPCPIICTKTYATQYCNNSNRPSTLRGLKNQTPRFDIPIVSASGTRVVII